MPKLIEYPKVDAFNSLIDWLDRNKPNVKYTLKAEYVKDGKKYEADCGQLYSGDPIISILYLLLSNQIYTNGSGVTNPTVAIFVNGTTSPNVNGSTSWLSTSYNFSGLGAGSSLGGSSNNFSIKFSTTISSQVSGTATVTSLVIGFLYGITSSGTANNYNFSVNTQNGTACGISVSAGSVVTWTLSGSVSQSNSYAGASWYIMLWNEIWAEFIAATGVSGAPTGLWQYPTSSSTSPTPLFKSYSIVVEGPNNSIIGAYNYPNTSNTAISNPSLTAGNSVGTLTSPSMSFTFTPTSNTTLETVAVFINVNGTAPSSPSTAFAQYGFIELSINDINQSVTANTPYSITVQDSVQVSQNT